MAEFTVARIDEFTVAKMNEFTVAKWLAKL
jgi:hypothetical protein